MEIDMVQLMILSVLVEQKATSPGMGMTLNEIVEEVNKSADFDYSPVTIKRKVWALRDKWQYVDAKLKRRLSDLFYITAKGREMREVLFSEEKIEGRN